MAYKVVLKDGSTITIANAVRADKDGSGTYLYNSDGAMIAPFSDGIAVAAYPADSEVTAPPPAPEVPEE